VSEFLIEHSKATGTKTERICHLAKSELDDIDPGFKRITLGFQLKHKKYLSFTYSKLHMKQLSIFIIAQFICLFAFSQAGTLDPTLVPGIGPNASVTGSCLMPNGKIVLVGDFTSYQGVSQNYVTRINSDGSIDPTFNIGTGALGAVFTCASQPDGKVLIGGNFTNFNGTVINRIARLNPDGSVDATFNIGTGATGGVVYAIAVQPDGKIVVGGMFIAFNGTPVNRIVRLNSNGTLDAAFVANASIDGPIRDFALESDGKIVVAGNFSSCNGVARKAVAKLNADGTLFTGFDPGVGPSGGMIRSVSVHSNGKVVVGGDFFLWNNLPSGYFMQLNANGTPDNGFNLGDGFGNFVFTTAIQPDGKILVGGMFNSLSGIPTNYLTRLNLDGSIDNTWNIAGTGAGNEVYTSTLQPDGKVIIGGYFGAYNGVSRNYVARLSLCGTLSIAGTVTNTTCFSGADGAINVTPSGGSSPYSYNWGGGITSEDRTGLSEGSYTVNVMDVNGCSVPAATFTVTQPALITHTYSDTSCTGSYVWNTQTYTSSGTYTQTLTNTSGCDSVVTAHLTIGLPTSYVFNATACDSYTLNDQTYTASGVYTQHRLNASGCDSTITLNLTVNDSDQASLTITACDSYTHNGQVYTASGTYIQNYTNADGCDSVLNLHITINHAAVTSFSDEACESYPWNSQIYTTSGIYTQSFSTVHGCDSMVTLNLSIYYPDSASTAISGCGEVTFNNETYTQSGSYIQHLLTTYGCDSTLTVNVVIIQEPTVTVTQIDDVTLQANAPGALVYQWIDCATNQPVLGADSSVFVAIQNGSYAVEIADSNCNITSNCVLIDEVGLSENASALLNLYPNPTSGLVTLSWKTPVNGTIRVSDLAGKTILVQPLSGQQFTELELTGANGIYLLEVNTGSKSEYFKVTKEF
jgi:uncharacterized delta-60 repeat protein